TFPRTRGVITSTSPQNSVSEADAVRAEMPQFMQRWPRSCISACCRPRPVATIPHRKTDESTSERRPADRGQARPTGRAKGRPAMIPGAFAYHRPSSVKDAVGLLAQFGDEGRPLAGGHSLIPMMKLRLATPANLVDLAGVAELKGIRAEGSDIVIG